MKRSIYLSFVCITVVGMLLAACGPSGPNLPPTQAQPSSQTGSSETGAQPTEASAAGGATTSGDASGDIFSAEREVPDLSALPIGVSGSADGPGVGNEWTCSSGNSNSGGAEGTGEWYNEQSGVWNFYLKPLVDGAVAWDSEISITVQGDKRIIEANGLPSGQTGIYPIGSSDDAYQYDRNPNSISAQSFHLELDANPTKNAEPQCVGGEIGVSIEGVVMNNALDALDRDAVATEIQDGCSGHPHQGGIYHYHGYSPCLEDQDAKGQSALIGYALDGFGIYGPYDENGNVLTSADLDECHGRTSLVEWDGEIVEMYHYVATFDFPYLVGCYWGDPVTFTDAISAEQGTTDGGNTGGPTQSDGNTSSGDQSGPPQEAIDACSGKSEGAACSIGSNNGTCTDIQGDLACKP